MTINLSFHFQLMHPKISLHSYLKLGISGESLGYRKIIDLEKLRKVLK